MLKRQERLSVMNFLEVGISGFVNESLTILTVETHSAQSSRNGVTLASWLQEESERRERGEHQKFKLALVNFKFNSNQKVNSNKIAKKPAMKDNSMWICCVSSRRLTHSLFWDGRRESSGRKESSIQIKWKSKCMIKGNEIIQLAGIQKRKGSL